MRLPGFEPGSSAWEAEILPLYYKRISLNYQFIIKYILEDIKVLISFVFQIKTRQQK